MQALLFALFINILQISLLKGLQVFIRQADPGQHMLFGHILKLHANLYFLGGVRNGHKIAVIPFFFKIFIGKWFCNFIFNFSVLF